MEFYGRYDPPFSDEEVERFREWHDAAYARFLAAGPRTLTYLGLELHVPGDVFAPTPTSHLLGEAVLERVRSTDRVLDMGTGSGNNAILAASRAREVVAVDLNPSAVAAARSNADRNGVADRVTVVEGDLFDPVDGAFDLIVYDPPFRWFRPRDHLEAAMADEGYRSLARFFAEAPRYLSPRGSMLVFFGTSGDLAHLLALADQAGFDHEAVAEYELVQRGMTVWYRTYLMEPRPTP